MLYGTDGLNEELVNRLHKAYQALKASETTTAEKAAQINLIDLVLISMVCNRLYGFDLAVAKPGKQPSAFFHTAETYKELSTLVEELGGITKMVRASLQNANSSPAVREELLIQGSSTMMKIFFLSCESVVALCGLIQGKPFTLTSLMEAALDKAYVKKNATTLRQKPKKRKGDS